MSKEQRSEYHLESPYWYSWSEILTPNKKEERKLISLAVSAVMFPHSYNSAYVNEAEGFLKDQGVSILNRMSFDEVVIRFDESDDYFKIKI